jgi:hypothetical protein
MNVQPYILEELIHYRHEDLLREARAGRRAAAAKRQRRFAPPARLLAATRRGATSLRPREA